MQWRCFGGIKFIFMAQRDFAIHLIILPNILEYMHIVIFHTGSADFVKINLYLFIY